MNKKFLSAILFGALMVSSTGTFVSCKDYDDDIENLQGQINTNKDAIAALQKLVGEGKWVTAISSIENGFTITMSDGTTQTVKGINGKDGVDGKNGTEWTIGEDGFWYKDGEKTAHYALGTKGEDGKPGANGVAAPSPQINAEGFWVVYEWDATAGKFVEKVTEVSAKGTSAYYVEKNGVIYLHIANQAGQFEEIALPAASDSFVVDAPAARVQVILEQTNWKVFTSKEHKARLAALTKAFPEIANYKKGDLMKQGGNLPLLVTPGNVELTDKFSFSLQNFKGEVSGAVVANPVKGLPADYDFFGSTLQTRAADAKDCFWTLSVEPEKNKKGDAYKNITELHTLVVENEKGTVVKTPFAYTIYANQNIQNVAIQTGANTIEYSDDMDVFAKYEGIGTSLFTINNGMNGHFIVEVAEPADVEKYGITINGSKLNIANFPTSEEGIWIRNVKVTALGLNGSTAEATQNIYVRKGIEAESSLSDKTITLSAQLTNGKYMNKVRWNVSELNMSAVNLEKFVNVFNKMAKLTWTDAEGNEQFKQYSISVFDKNGNSTSDYKTAATFGFDFESKDLTPNDYAVLVKAETFAASANLKVVNPTATVIALYPELVNDKGVLQIVGTPAGDKVQYTMAEGLKYSNAIVTIKKFVDMDADVDDYTATSWIKNETTLEVFKNGVKHNGVAMKQMYITRNFKVEYTMFGNPNNVQEMLFQGEVVSELYHADPTKAIILNDAKLAAIFSADKKKNTIDLASAVTKAIVAAGPDRGKTYELFAKENKDKVTTTYNYSQPKEMNGKLVKGANFVEMTEEVWIAALNLTAETNNKVYFTTAAWNSVWGVASKYFNTDGTAIKDKKVTEADQMMVDIFKAYKAKADFASTTTIEPVAPTPADARLKSVEFSFADATTAAKYVVNSTGIGTSITAKSTIDEDIPGGKVVLAVNLTIVDQWGMKMVRTFNVTLSTK